MARVLLVDDDELLRSMLRTLLERFGHDVVTATNGHDAIVRHREQSVDLVITDIIMPDMEGIELIRALRHDDPAMKIIAMSGGGRAGANDYLDLAKQLGAEQILSKPFSQQELRDAITAVLGS